MQKEHAQDKEQLARNHQNVHAGVESSDNINEIEKRFSNLSRLNTND
ncbi:9561_t:CDS:2 [Dentiscutata erythropus]|uniref:9561_t:CDS:1 n=1 Tax=Dentiscutata erythropus TaxID=1348616 RepID=A0A9N9H699_9GLOM|nr:9561_t:CDS:2 [Dentiscutata erythropus]